MTKPKLMFTKLLEGELMNMKIDIIIPCYNSESTIEKVVKLSTEQLKLVSSVEKFNFILVNDDSKDNTLGAIERIAKEFDNVIGIDLALNVGQHNAIIAGMNHSQGDLVLCMDDDMQTHPTQLPLLIESFFESNYDVLYAVYKQKKHSSFKNFGSKLNNFLYDNLLGRPKGIRASSFWICKSFVRDEIIKGKSQHTNLQGLFYRTTKRVGNIEVTHFEREVGVSNYTLKKSIKLFMSFLNYTDKLIQVILAMVLFLIALFVVISTLYFFPSARQLLSSSWFLTAIMILLNIIQLVAILIIGVIVLRGFEVTTHKPQYVVRRYLKGENNE